MFTRWKAEAHQHVLGPILVGVAPQLLKAIAQGRVGFERGFSTGGIGHIRLQSLQPDLHGLQGLKGGHHLLPQAVIALQAGPLRQVADAQSAGAVDAPTSRPFLAEQDTKQRGFARAVAAHQGNAIAVGHAARDVPKDVLRVERFGDPLRNKNRHSPSVSERAHYTISLGVDQFLKGINRVLLARYVRGTMVSEQLQ